VAERGDKPAPRGGAKKPAPAAKGGGAKKPAPAAKGGGPKKPAPAAKGGGGAGGLRRFLLSGSGWPYLLVPFIPIAIVLEFAHADAVLIFAAAAAGVIPTAALMGRATEELAHRAGPGIGGFLNVTFGNAPELIIAFFALNEGLQEVVKASLIGSILGNILLVMGAAMLVGGLKRERQTFNPTAASVQSSMLLLAAAALVMPTIATTISPTKNSLRPIVCDASEIEPTRISDITPTATPAPASVSADLLTLHGSSMCSSASDVGLKRARCERSENKRPPA